MGGKEAGGTMLIAPNPICEAGSRVREAAAVSGEEEGDEGEVKEEDDDEEEFRRE